MASINVTANDIFPTGTLIGAYPAQGRWSLPSNSPPPVAADATATMADGGVPLVGLRDETDYFIGGDVGGGVYRYVRTTTRIEVDGSGGGSGGGSGFDPTAAGVRLDPAAAATGHDVDLWIVPTEPVNKASGHVWVKTAA